MPNLRESLVTVYLPTRNRVEMLRRAVQSVLAQSHRQFELIVVNDGSIDGTERYLAEVVASDERVRAIGNSTSMGAPHCRNRAIVAARGEFVTGLDDDDRFHPHRLSSFLAYWELLERAGERFSCLYSQDYIDQGDSRSVSQKMGSAQASQLFTRNLVGNQVFARKETFIAAGLFDERMPAWQDMDLFIRMLGCAGEARLLDMPLYYFNHEPRPDRISRTSREVLRTAYRGLLAKSRHASAGMKQALFLQMFDDFYGLRLRAGDLVEFMRYGFDLRNTAQLCKLMVKQIARH